MTELLELVLDSLPAAIGFAAVALLCTTFLRVLLRKPPLTFCSTAACIYLGLLLAGTLRPERVQDLFQWTKPWQMNVTFQLDPTEAISSLHGLFNIALFLPFGLLGMLLGKRIRAAFPTLLTSILMSLFIEVYQLYHMRSFDFGDVATNTFGCLIGILLALPFVIMQKKTSASTISTD